MKKIQDPALYIENELTYMHVVKQNLKEMYLNINSR